MGHWSPILGPSPETSGVSRYTGPVQMKGLCRYLTSAIRVPLPLIRPLVDPLPVYTSPQALLIPCRELPDLLCLILYRCVPSLKTLPIQETQYSYLKQVTSPSFCIHWMRFSAPICLADALPVWMAYKGLPTHRLCLVDISQKEGFAIRLLGSWAHLCR